jgi:Mn2+/Fe2+ NRAMP family transporter
MAVGIDLGFVALELAQLMIGERLRRQVARYARPAIVGTLAGSAVMNAVAFGSQAATTILMAAGVALGVAIPALIFCLIQVGAALAKDCHARR